MSRLALQRLIDKEYDRLLACTVAEVRDLASCGLSGDDSPYTDLWLEYAAQVQGQHGFTFKQYENMLVQFCEKQSEDLPDFVARVLWFGTEGSWDWSEPSPPGLLVTREHVAEELFRRLSGIAVNEELPG